MCVPDLLKLLARLTVPSEDDGEKFVREDRICEIKGLLSTTLYESLCANPLAMVYRHTEFRTDKPLVLVSTHVDSVYSRYFCCLENELIRGTFDNSATNAVAIFNMRLGTLDPQVVVAFTGDEEEDSRGADQVVACCRQHDDMFSRLEMVVTLDLTEEHFGCAAFTVENYFREKANDHSVLRFDRKRELRAYVATMLGDMPTVFVKDAEADESWQYDEYDLNCFSFCLPCHSPSGDMHDDSGVVVRLNDLAIYSDALCKLLARMTEDLANSWQRADGLATRSETL